MKTILFFVLLQSVFAFSQEKEIVRILNSELKSELRKQTKHPLFEGDTIILMKDFSIDQNKILSVEIKRENPNEDGFIIEKQEIPLKEIKYISKDINVILEPIGRKVKVTRTYLYKNGKQETGISDYDLFFTHIRFPDNEYIGDNLVKAFKKAGFEVNKLQWYD